MAIAEGVEINTTGGKSNIPKPPPKKTFAEKLSSAANIFNQWRVFPRIFLGVYIFLLHDVVQWFMALPDPNTQQAGLVSVIVGAGAAWFGLYTSTGPKID